MTLGSHQTTVGRSQVHLTPRWILDALGPFDLDPCAASPRPWDCASRNITEAENGLKAEWSGRVWLNPPFNRYGIDAWLAKMAAHGRGIILLHARTETEWFNRVWGQASALLFLSDRVTFCKPDGTPQTISNPASKHYGKPANSGAPVVLAAFGDEDFIRLSTCGLRGHFVSEWIRLPSLSQTVVDHPELFNRWRTA